MLSPAATASTAVVAAYAELIRREWSSSKSDCEVREDEAVADCRGEVLEPAQSADLRELREERAELCESSASRPMKEMPRPTCPIGMPRLERLERLESVLMRLEWYDELESDGRGA